MEANYRISRTFEFFVNSLFARVTERQKENKAAITEAEALQLVEAVVVEAKSSVAQEIEDRAATKDFVKNEINDLCLEFKENTGKIREEMAAIKTSIADTRAEIIKWMVGIQIAAASLIIAIMKLT